MNIKGRYPVRPLDSFSVGEFSICDATEQVKPGFREGDEILAYHRAMIYVAKILDTNWEEEKSEWYYLIHYKGWNKSWDEWRPSHEIMVINTENLRLQKKVTVDTLTT